MSSSVLWFVARRHLAGGRRNALLSLITWIALAGVTVGVSALIVVTAVMTGMQRDLRAKILEAAPHVLVQQKGTSLRLDGWREVVDRALATESVVAAAPFVLTQVSLVRSGSDGLYPQAAQLFGVLPEGAAAVVTELEGKIASGVHDLTTPPSGLAPLLIGRGVADRMQLFEGDTVIVISFENLQPDLLAGLRPAMRRFEVTGIFSTGIHDYDVAYAYTTLAAARELVGISNDATASGVGVRVSSPDLAAAAADRLAVELGYPYHVRSWEDSNQALFSALKLEKIAMGVILFLVVLVAAFNIVSTLTMVVADRTREIGILRAIGMRGREIMRIFVIQGMWIGVAGTALGALLGLTTSLLIDRYELIRIPPSVYLIDHLPVALDPADLIWIVTASVAVSLLATIYPARQAARMAPVDAIRHD